jgi:hypothetical protein
MKATETGVLIGYIPQGVAIKGVAASEAVLNAARWSVVIYYLRVTSEARRLSHVPARHREIVRTIYAHGGFDRELPETGGGEFPSVPPEFAIVEAAASGLALIRAVAYGSHWKEHLRSHLDALRASGIEYVMLDLPLANPLTPAACEEAEALGFFFGAIIPEKLPSGDLLRLQYLNNLDIDPASVVTASAFGAALLDYVAGCRRR